MQTVPDTLALSSEVRFFLFVFLGLALVAQVGVRQEVDFFFLLIWCLFSHYACCLHQPTQGELQEAESAVNTRKFTIIVCNFFPLHSKTFFFFKPLLRWKRLQVIFASFVSLDGSSRLFPHSAHITDVNLLLLLPLWSLLESVTPLTSRPIAPP